MQKAAEARAAAPDWLARERVVGKARQKPRQRDLRFEPRKVQSRAGMDAESEGDMPIRLAAEIEPIGIRKLRWIAVRGTNADGDARFRWQLDTADDDLVG